MWELWPYLCCGASIHTVADHTRNDPELLIDWLHAHHITITFIPTPLAETLLDRPWPPNSPLRYLLTGGDTLHHHPNPDHPYTLINHYGPTETTVVATATTTNGITPGHQAPTIGGPITNTTITIVDPAGHPAGPHQPGELTISGPTLARGYHHDPTLTNQRFTTTTPEPAATTPATSPAGTTTAPSPTSAAPTTNSKSAATASNPPNSKRSSPPTPTSPTPPSPPTPTPPPTPPNSAPTSPPPNPPPHQPNSPTRSPPGGRCTSAPTVPIRLATARFDIRGWNSSANGTPLGPSVMGEQVDQVVARILALRPKTILEVGCGTGLLTHRLVPHCERYVGTDFSATVVAQLRQAVDVARWPNVELLEREALDLDGIDGLFDVVVLNSVVQYFPSIAYLDSVLDRCVAAVAPHGAVFVGDVRNRALLDVFHTDVERSRADPATPVDELAARVARAVANEQELLVDPGWFTEFAANHRRITNVAAEPRRGHHDNELTRYRYDVTLAFDDAVVGFDGPWVEWESAGLTPLELVALLTSAAREPVGVRGVPSARLVQHVEACRLVAAGDVRVAALETRPAGGVDPEQLWGLDGVAVEIGWHEGGSSGCYDVVATPVGTATRRLPRPRTVRAGRGQRSDRRHCRPDHEHPPLAPHTAAGAARPDPHRRPRSGAADTQRQGRPRRPTRSRVRRPRTPMTANPSRSRKLPLPKRGRTLSAAAASAATTTSSRSAAIRSWPSSWSTGRPRQVCTSRPATSSNTRRSPSWPACASSTPRVTAEQGAVVGPVPLTPVQRWFVELRLDERHHFNQAASIPLDRNVDPRLLVARAAGGGRSPRRPAPASRRGDELSFDGPGGELKVITADLSSASPSELAKLLDRAGTRVQSSVSLDGGAVRAALFDLGPLLPRRMLVAIHHLAVDAVSWSIILEDLWIAYEQLAAGRPAALPPKTTSFREWSRRLGDHAGDAEVSAEIEFWRDQLDGDAVTLPVDHPDGANTVGDSTTVRVELTADETGRLLRGPTSELLIAAAVGSLARWAGVDEIALAVEGHGRESILADVDLTRTVGWFTTIYPLRMRVKAIDDARGAARRGHRTTRTGAPAGHRFRPPALPVTRCGGAQRTGRRRAGRWSRSTTSGGSTRPDRRRRTRCTM